MIRAIICFVLGMAIAYALGRLCGYLEQLYWDRKRRNRK